MELGLQYSWRYWKSVQELSGLSDGDNDIGMRIADLSEESQNADESGDQ